MTTGRLSTCLCGRAIEVPGSADSYPFDPLAPRKGTHQLDLLRTLEDRVIAHEAYELYWAQVHQSTCQRYQRRRQR